MKLSNNRIAETLIETPKDQTNEYEILKKKEWESLLKTFFHDSEKISNWYKEKEDLLQPILKVDDKSTYEELTKFIPVVQKINEEYLKVIFFKLTKFRVKLIEIR